MMLPFVPMLLLKAYREAPSAGSAETKDLSDKLRPNASGEDREGNHAGESLMAKAMARTPGPRQTRTSLEGDAGEGDKAKALTGEPELRQVPTLTGKWPNGPLCPGRFR